MVRDSKKQRFERCVLKLKKRKGINPFAVCRASIFKRKRK